jgi:hypothetical protein
LASLLISRGYRLADCTIDNEDYVFNAAYLKALARSDHSMAAPFSGASPRCSICAVSVEREGHILALARARIGGT